MFGLGFGEMAVIVILAIVVVGPSRLPTLLKTVGGAMRQLRQASRDIRTSVGFDELIDLDAPPKRPVARVRPPVEASVAQSAAVPDAVHSAPAAAPQTPAPQSAAPQTSGPTDKVGTPNTGN